ncbi:hypothetical protein BpHYR1_016181 [Brachionus plicatilis]|uniref:Uncharacterized protein n=1 Tax=Brachionus plicatilis TaxID=10195 RepID=A0A3M7R4E4_BRAPC|nr:hypothetical protein BpHYR1_016181 [Brachionus plicatilis]
MFSCKILLKTELKRSKNYLPCRGNIITIEALERTEFFILSTIAIIVAAEKIFNFCQTLIENSTGLLSYKNYSCITFFAFSSIFMELFMILLYYSLFHLSLQIGSYISLDKMTKKCSFYTIPKKSLSKLFFYFLVNVQSKLNNSTFNLTTKEFNNIETIEKIIEIFDLSSICFDILCISQKWTNFL